jgi:hypothetical protein
MVLIGQPGRLASRRAADCAADRGIPDRVKRLRAIRHLIGVAEAHRRPNCPGPSPVLVPVLARRGSRRSGHGIWRPSMCDS